MLREKLAKFTSSKQLKEIRVGPPDTIPNMVNPTSKVVERPIATFVPTFQHRLYRGGEEREVLVLEPHGRVSLEKKERIKIVSEALS